ncbi:MAG: hypothetical protein NVS3B21_10070 [Acidimicrobiales bacterium]
MIKKLVALRTPMRIVAVLALLGVSAVGLHLVQNGRETTVTAYFAKAEGIYRGDDVKILGVKVGRISDITPEGSSVRVTLEVSSDQPIPSGARAAIVSPSLVSGRFVQLSPAYTSGPRMTDGSTIPLQRTAIPVSFDDVKNQLIDLSSALAPRGSTDQPLQAAINAIDANLRAGNADALKRAIAGLRAAAGALSDGRSNLFGTISNLNSFTQNLAINDAAVAGFTSELGTVGEVLSTNRQQLTQAVRSLAAALQATGKFLGQNRERIRTSVSELNLLTAAIADRSNEVAGTLHVASTVISDLHNIIEHQALTGRASLTALDDVPSLLCGLVLGAGGTAEQCRQALAPLLSALKTANGDPSKVGQQASVSPPGRVGSGGLLGGLTSLLPGLFDGSAGSR